MKHVLLILAVLMVGMSGADAATPPASQPAPEVLAKGQDYVVHWLKNDGIILHIRISTLTPTVLVAERPTRPVRPGETDSGTGIVAVSVDDQRLYVLLDNWWERYNPPPNSPQHIGGYEPPRRDEYLLQAYWLADGARICSDSVSLRILAARGNRVTMGEPATRPSAPLKLIGGGVVCGGIEYHFEGRKLIERESAAKPTTMP